MANMTLKEKVNTTVFWASVFCAGYFAVGFILKTSLFTKYPSANDFYDLIRDSFTLTAYFIAPAAALVLFSDWRVQHNITKSDSFFDSIELDFYEMYSIIEDAQTALQSRSRITVEYEEYLGEQIERLSKKEQEMYVKIKTFKYNRNDEGRLFLDKAKELVRKVGGIILQLIVIHASLGESEDESENDLNGGKFVLARNVEIFNSTYNNFPEHLSELNKLKPII